MSIVMCDDCEKRIDLDYDESYDVLNNEREIISALTESQLKSDEMEIWDGEPEMYINQGWQEALQWVIGLRKLKRYKLRREDG